MTRLYLIRHAQAQEISTGCFRGGWTASLSARGQEQIKFLARRCKEYGIQAIYSSPLIRAYETAKAVNEYYHLPIFLKKEIIEIDGGRFEGHSFADLPQLFPREFDLWENDPAHFTAPGGESMKQVYQRMQRGIEAILQENQGKTIAVFSHGCAIRNYQCFLHGWGVEKINEIGWCENTSVNLIEYDKDLRPRILYLSDASHLPNKETCPSDVAWWKTKPPAAVK